MWFAVAVWFLSSPPMAMPVVNIAFDSKTECIEYIVSNSDFNIVIHEQPNIIFLDDGVEDRFAIACQTRTKEVDYVW